MSGPAIEHRTQELGRILWARMRQYRAAPAELAADRLMVALASMPHFRPRLLRFVDAVAGLVDDRRGQHTQRLLREYLGHQFPDLPAGLNPLVRLATLPCWPSVLVGATARAAVASVASRFIASGGQAGALEALMYLRERRRFPSFDILGESVTSESEADRYRGLYLDLLDTLGRAPGAGRRTASGALELQVSLKLSSLTADFNPVDPTGSLRRVRPRLEAIAEAARRRGIAVTLDMEHYETRDLALSIFFDVFGPDSRFADWDGIGVVLQAYLRDGDMVAAELLRFARLRATAFQVRLVKGAYWDYETVVAQENGWPSLVWERQSETDLAFEGLSEELIAAIPAVNVAIASHNLRSHAHAEAVREACGLQPGAVEHQTLFRTAEGISRALESMGWPARDYVPLGELLPGMAYLVRRILENSSQTGFLLHSRSGDSVDDLLRAPSDTPADRTNAVGEARPVTAPQGFLNQPPKRLFLEQERVRFESALRSVRRQFGREYTLRLGGIEVRTSDRAPVHNPSHPAGSPLGYVHHAGEGEVDQALALATHGSGEWGAASFELRAGVLGRAATLLAEQQDVVAAWEVYEAAKSWTEALADVSEAIDYLRFYARGALTLAPALREFRPRGIVAVIPPWNFPAAIPCGMTAAALVTGNAVILKPAEQTPLVAWQLVRVLHEAGVPEDALIWLAGRGELAGGRLAASAQVDMVAFTGSAAVGASLYRTGSAIRLQRNAVRATVAEMGGKNPILVFADADLDEAVVGILASAFGHSGQKCSAASRVLIHRSIYARLRERLVEGARSLVIGPADRAGSVLTPLIDTEARLRVSAAIERAGEDGHVLLAPEVPSTESVESRPAIVEVAAKQHRSSATAQAEIFGPVLTLTPFDNDQQALALANSTRYALTAGVYSRSPGTIQHAVAELEAGNIYVNRPTTGARVGIEPFGGYRMSGTGPKAGGREYLWAFVRRTSGLRRGSVAQRSGGRIPVALERWSAPPERRRATVERAIDLLTGAWNAEWQRAWAGLGGAGAVRPGLDLLSLLAGQFDEIARPEPTARLRGQQTSIRWDRARGCGVVLTDTETRPEDLLALALAPLLAGNGIALDADARHGALAELLARSLLACGVPARSLQVAEEGFDLPQTLALSPITFAAVDAGRDQTQEIYSMLAAASGTAECPTLKALIVLADGPLPGQSGFLRRFALPRTVALRTLHLGAELELG